VQTNNRAAERKKRSRPISEINVTPFVDVMLVLLVVFMVTAPLLVLGIPVQLPKVSKEYIIADDDTPLNVEVDEEKRIYINKKESHAIVHAHSPHATAVSSHGKPIPPFHYMIALAGGEDIKCAEYATFGTEELSKNVIKALENRSACLMSNHGQVAFGKNLEDAFELAQEIENICHQYTIALKLGEPKILSFEEMKKVLDKAKNYKKG